MKQKVVGITGCRSEYDILYSVFKRLDSEPKFELSVIVSGAHLAEKFGYTLQEIEDDGFTIAGKVHNLINSDQTIGKAKGAGLLLTGLSELLCDLNPDYVIAAGDREEPLIAGIACTYLGIPLLHIGGGDKTYPGEKLGDVDEQVRHAVTKLASAHFPMAKEHEERLLSMGEESWRICCAGNPALDRFMEIPLKRREEITKYFGFQDHDKPLGLLIQHVISSEREMGSEQIRLSLEALKELDINCVVNYPNSDMGSQGIISVIEEFRECRNFSVTRNIRRDYFVNLLRNIDVLIGNSSMAFLEGAYLSLPAINVGRRQKGRLHGGNVVFVDHNKEQIRNAVERVIFDDEFRKKLKKCQQIYGDGRSSERIITYLKELKKSKEELVSKKITY
ncbi:MAG: UDP-N-acetylglucosamine 2-epimerase (hydrolyzing) [Deltaproteobacteria bacterium]|nr:UDP-N-acetylglucosamine 2-epimerase (hydrolyzing) [Deltaproteobacteria bacterium]